MLDEEAEVEMVDREIEGRHYFHPVFEKSCAKNPMTVCSANWFNRVIEEWAGRQRTTSCTRRDDGGDNICQAQRDHVQRLWPAGIQIGLIENKHTGSKLKSDPDKYIEGPLSRKCVRLESPVQSLDALCGGSGRDGHGCHHPQGRADQTFLMPPPTGTESVLNVRRKSILERQRAGAHMGLWLSGVHHLPWRAAGPR